MEEFQVVIQSLGALPYGGLFIFFLIVNVFVPIPEELFILGLGYIGKLFRLLLPGLLLAI